MSSTKESPRQRMVSMMYLVLYTLLALNISKDVINAFVVVNDNIVLTNKSIDKRLSDIYQGFDRNLEFNPGKVKPYWEKAQQAKAFSKELLEYIDQIKYEIVSKTEEIPLDSAKIVPVRELTNKDNYQIPTHYFLGNSDSGNEGEAIKLKTRIDEFREKILGLVDKNQFKDIQTNLATSGPYFNADGQKQNWQNHFFYNTILAADLAILNKFKADVYNAEYEVVNHLYKSIGKGNFKFDKIEAKVLPKSNFVFWGGRYQAEVVVAAYDTTQNPTVFYKTGINYLPNDQSEGASVVSGKPGKIMIDLPATQEGINEFAGLVKQTNAEGKTNYYHFSSQFIVSQPSVTVSAKKMNVFYIGVDNPVSISVPGIPSERLTPSISVGTIKKNRNNNDWMVRVPQGVEEAVIRVGINIDGSMKYLNSKVFRVKDLPTPIATVGGKNSGGINQDIMLAAGAVVPKMPDDFDFDQTFVITSFTMTLQRGFQVYHFKSKNSYFTPEMRKQIQRTNRGQNIIFEHIVAKDMNDSQRTLAPIILTID
ncbi:MAG: gliding motility protein GldM [Bacteroidales bacterium]|nr:gliding motility protein GldM [Bacteroidales bacterium]